MSTETPRTPAAARGSPRHHWAPRPQARGGWDSAREPCTAGLPLAGSLAGEGNRDCWESLGREGHSDCWESLGMEGDSDCWESQSRESTVTTVNPCTGRETVTAGSPWAGRETVTAGSPGAGMGTVTAGSPHREHVCTHPRSRAARRAWGRRKPAGRPPQVLAGRSPTIPDFRSS